MKAIDVIELWFYGRYRDMARSLLVVSENNSFQQYTSSIVDALPYIIDSMAGLCGVRVSISPRGEDINDVPVLESILLDNDSPENFELAKYTALKQAESIEKLGGKAVVIFTGGKGYSVRAWLSKEYEGMVDRYNTIVKNVASLVESLAKTELLNAKALVRIPYTRHERSGNQVLVVDPSSGEHIKDPDRAYKLIADAIDNPIPFHETLLEEERELRKIKVAEEERPKRRLPKFVEMLIDYLKERGELCHKARLAIASWMLRAGYTEDEIVDVFRYANDFDERITRRQIASAGKYVISCRNVVESCKDDIPEGLCE